MTRESDGKNIFQRPNNTIDILLNGIDLSRIFLL